MNVHHFWCYFFRKEKRNLFKKQRNHLIHELNNTQKISLELASVKRSSIGIQALLMQRYNFDYLCLNSELEYFSGTDGTPKRTLHVRQKKTVSHAIHCLKGGYTHIRRSAIGDELVKLRDLVCYDVSVETNLQPLQRERSYNKSTNREN